MNRKNQMSTLGRGHDRSSPTHETTKHGTPLHPALVAALGDQDAAQDGATRLQALLRDPEALTETLQGAVATAIQQHRTAGRPIYSSEGGVIYEEDGTGTARPYRPPQHRGW